MADFQEEAKTVIEFVSKKEAIIFINATVSTNAADLNATPLTSANGLAENQTSLDTLIMYDVSGVDAATDLSWILINISYDDSDLDRNGDGIADINENALMLYWYCEDPALCPDKQRWFPINKGGGLIIKGGPEVFDTGVNTEKNYIWANISHFSKYGLVGEVLVSEEENTETTSGGGGGGGGSASLKPTFLEKWKDKVIDSDEIVNILEYTTSTFKIKYTVDPRLAAVYSAKGKSVVSKNTADLIFTRTSALSVNPKGDVFELASKFVLEKYGGPKKVVIARGDLEADSIAASTFANLIGAPILLVKPDEIPYATQKVLEKYQVYLSEMYIIGGPAAVSKGVEDELRMYCLNCRTFERIWGKTRYETSIEVAKMVMGLKNTGAVMITDGQNPVVYSASLAFIYDAPIVYVDQHSPKSVDDFIAEQGFETVGRLYYSES